MAVTGLIMVLYLLAHMYGNLKVFASKKAFDDYAHHLRELGEPILPHTGALWIIRVVLLASVHTYDRDNGRRLDNGYPRHYRDG